MASPRWPEVCARATCARHLSLGALTHAWIGAQTRTRRPTLSSAPAIALSRDNSAIIEAARGRGEAELDEIAAQRAELAAAAGPSERETIVEYGILGRFTAFFLAVATGNLLANLFGTRIAALGVSSIFLVYALLLGRRIVAQYRHGAGTSGSMFMAYQIFEAGTSGLVGFMVFVFAAVGQI